MISVQRYYVLIYCLLIAALPLHGQEQKDTLLLEEVIISINKNQPYAVGARITTLDSNTISPNRSSNLADLLESRTPIYVKSYGAGMLSTVSFRGTSGSQTALLWNGFNIGYSTAGLTDFAIIPLNGVSSVYIQHGSASSNFGSGCLGGAIIIHTEPSFTKKLNLRVQQDVGSFNQRYSSAGLTYSNSKIEVNSQVYYKRSVNDFKYHNIFKEGSPFERQVNAGVEQYGFVQDLHYKFNKKLFVSLKSWYNFSHRQIQPVMGTSNIHAREKDENVRISPSLQYKCKLGITTLRGAFFKDKIYYNDDHNLPSNSNANTYQSQLEHEWNLPWLKWKLKSGLEYQHFQLLVNAYGGKVNENRASGYLLLRYDPISKLHFNLNLRQGLAQGFTVPFTPSFGMSYQVLETKASVTSIKINISKGYRVPGFNDRFWVPGGNPHLRPESSSNYEAGLVYKRYLKKATWENELTFYHMLVNDWIQWLPKGKSSLWTAQNIFQVRAQGIELSTKYSFKVSQINYSVGAAYSYNSSVVAQTYEQGTFPVGNQLIYVPLHKAIFFFESNLKSWLFNTNFSFNGYRYTTSSNDSYLPGYSLLNIVAGKKFKFNQVELQLLLKVNNLLNHEYQNMENVAVPLRNYSLSIRMNYNK